VRQGEARRGRALMLGVGMDGWMDGMGSIDRVESKHHICILSRERGRKGERERETCQLILSRGFTQLIEGFKEICNRKLRIREKVNH
jgi:hypothetical protein